MKYVSEKYEKQLADLAETLCTPERFARPLGQLVLFASDMGRTTVALSLVENTPNDAA